VAHPAGIEVVHRTAVGPQSEATALGEGLAQALLAEGVDRLLRESR